ncbi:hypothetical protein BP6252_08870 [Coleophoma cylindrospora]|uniref:Heterokaryon incompatibility domain-containing protein n=1 Tax=Coleophoma cylindrospora TaxID=1849047 RepID=A0A3D8R7E1_9HELO|nr:hypothetical protein BP6252_08870 [Coleophoma cylindrospora]
MVYCLNSRKKPPFCQQDRDMLPLLLASRNLKSLSERTRTLLRAIIRFRAQEQEYGGFSKSARMCLFDALVMSRHSLATDPRDKVYALLGMTSDGSNLVPLPMYTRPVDKIFHGVTNEMTKSQQPRNILLLAKWAPLQERSKNSAGWCVDWAEPSYPVPPWLTKVPRSVPNAVSSRVEFDGSRLLTQGRLIATITEVQGARPIVLASPEKSSRRFACSANRPSGTPIERQIGYYSPEFDRITDALARMIRDVNKREASADYDISCVEDVLHLLGELPWQGNPIWEWARQYNSARTSDDPDSSDDNETIPSSARPSVPSTPPQESLQLPLHEKKAVSGSLLRLVRWSRDTGTAVDSPWSPRPQAPPQAAFQFWEDVLAALDVILEFKLRFSLAVHTTTKRRNLVLVCEDAKPGDQIYQIEHADLPVVLRSSHGTFGLIGEVYVTRQENGKWSMAHPEVPADDPFQAPPAPDVESLSIQVEKGSPRRNPSYESLYLEWSSDVLAKWLYKSRARARSTAAVIYGDNNLETGRTCAHETDPKLALPTSNRRPELSPGKSRILRLEYDTLRIYKPLPGLSLQGNLANKLMSIVICGTTGHGFVYLKSIVEYGTKDLGGCNGDLLMVLG